MFDTTYLQMRHRKSSVKEEPPPYLNLQCEGKVTNIEIFNYPLHNQVSFAVAWNEHVVGVPSAKGFLINKSDFNKIVDFYNENLRNK